MVALTCVIPVYNESDIKEFVEEIKELLREIDHEIIVVDDGNIEPIKLEGVTVIRHPINRGYGAAIKTGILKAHGERILIVDADGTYPLKDIPKLLDENYDMVVGSRKTSMTPIYRRPAKWLMKLLASYLSGKKIPDLNSGMRVFRKDLALKFLYLYPDGFSFTTTLTLAFLCNGYIVKYVPIDYYPRKGKSKIRPVEDWLTFMLLIIRTIVYFNPLKVFLPLSAIMFILAGFIFVYSTFIMGKVMDITVISITLSAVEIGLFGLLADLIVRGRNTKG